MLYLQQNRLIYEKSLMSTSCVGFCQREDTQDRQRDRERHPDASFLIKRPASIPGAFIYHNRSPAWTRLQYRRPKRRTAPAVPRRSFRWLVGPWHGFGDRRSWHKLSPRLTALFAQFARCARRRGLRTIVGTTVSAAAAMQRTTLRPLQT